MTTEIVVAIITVVGSIVLLGLGFLVNRRLRLPDNIQKTIREERAFYEKALEDKANRLEDELEEERKARGTDRSECEEKITALTDLIISKDIIIGRLMERLVVLERAQGVKPGANPT